MRAPTKSEQLLLIIFGAMILGFVGIVIWGWFQKSLTQQRTQEIILQEQIDELRRWQGEKDIWETRGRWLAANPPPLWSREDSEATFVQELQRSVAVSGIEILSQRLAGTESLRGFEEVNVQLTIRASTEELVRWLHDLQQPGKYLAVSQLNLRADGEGENLRAEIQLTRFYRVVDGSPMLEESQDMQQSPQEEENNFEEPGDGRVPMSPPDAIEPLTPSPLPTPETSSPDVSLPTEDGAMAEEELPPNPVLPFDDVFDPSNPDEPIQSPDEAVFELLPVPETQ
jgi:hypothetical protein